MHLLEPSLMYRDRYNSNVGSQRVTWHMQGNTIQSLSASGTIKATVLSEELAYNRALQQFKIFILDRPLDPEYKPSATSTMIQDSLKVKRTYHEQKIFLLSFYHHKQPLAELDAKISSFFKNYMIVETESLLQDTASKLRAMAHQAATSFLAANSDDERMSDRRIREVVWLAVEGVLLCSVHTKVYPAVCGLHKKQEAIFNKRCHLLRGKLTPQFLGLSNDFQSDYRKTLGELNKMDSISSPLEGLYTFQDALENIMEDVRDNFRNSLRLGEPPPLASDDLIALLATIVVQMECSHLLSSVYYMEHFHWSLSDADRLSFSLVTLRAVVEYLKGPEVEKLLPAAKEPQRRPPPKILESQSSSSWTSLGSIATPPIPLDDIKTAEHHIIVSKPSRGERKKKEEKKSELGPFLSMLMTSETVSSNFYSDS
ncbi:uncharacterized protein LOC135339343 isoform X2 [Halichondria panicea]